MLRLMMSCLLVGVLSVIVLAGSYSGGTGEPNDPYQIASAEDLVALGNEPNDYNDCFVLSVDIDLSGYTFDRAVIAPAFTKTVDGLYRYIEGQPFCGRFDGQGYTISNMVIDGNEYLGLFGYVGENAVLKHLTLASVDVNGTGNNIGGLVGRFTDNTVVDSVEVNGTVMGQNYVGGLIGSGWGACVIGCTGNCRVSGNVIVGGLLGSNYRVASRVEYYEGSPIMGCCNTGHVSGTVYVGGLAGCGGGSTLFFNVNRGTVTGERRVGGLIGEVGNSDIIACLSYGLVEGEDYTGGLVGSTKSETNTLACFWDIETSGQLSSDEGTGLTTAQMQDPNTYLLAGWDLIDETTNGICDVWQMQEGEYPNLAASPEPNGTGSVDDPYVIWDAKELGTVWRRPLAHYRLEKVIDLEGVAWSVSVVPWFGGVFNGNDYGVDHLQIDGGNCLGFFGELSADAQITHFSLRFVDVNGMGQEVGALVGYNQGIVTACSSQGQVNGDDVVGGLVATNEGEVFCCTSSCRVGGDKYVGSLVGRNIDLIRSSYATGPAYGDCYTGGLVGANTGSLLSCYSVGPIIYQESPDSSSDLHGVGLGGLVGTNLGTVTSSFWDIETSGLLQSAGGIGLATAQMQAIDTYLDAGWDFMGETDNGTDDLWWMPESSYPRLWWE